MQRQLTNYKGWCVVYNEDAPAYTRYQATQFGVRVSNSTIENLIETINRKIEERKSGW